MIADLIKNFSAGEIPLKYDFIRPQLSYKKINIISYIFFAIIFISTIGLLSVLKYKYLAVYAFVFYGILLIFTEFYFRTKVYRYTKNGWILFKNESFVFEIEIDGEKYNREVQYSEIIIIRIKHGLPKTYLGRKSRRTFGRISMNTYWKLKDGTKLILDIKAQFEIPKDKKLVHSNLEPDIINVLANIPTITGQPNLDWL